MLSNAAAKFRAWCAREEEGHAVERFRRGFALLWLTYDVLDLWVRGTGLGTVLFGNGNLDALRAIQVALIVAQALLALGVRPGALALVCCALRAAEAQFFFSLNDFYYYSTVMFILSAAARGPSGRALAWPRDVLLWQAAWIYGATAVLKLNPEWLSGGHLFVRTQYLAGAFEWPYPAFARTWTASLPFDAVLAYLGLALELSLAALLAFRAPRRFLLPLAIALHGFAALTVNVWFFGAAMVMQVALSRRYQHFSCRIAARKKILVPPP
jgi:hypothetical protein